MEYVYAALMLHKLKKEITEENVTSIVKASGAELNEAKVKSLVASLADVNIEDAIKAAPVVAAAAPAAAPAEPAKHTPFRRLKFSYLDCFLFKSHIPECDLSVTSHGHFFLMSNTYNGG